MVAAPSPTTTTTASTAAFAVLQLLAARQSEESPSGDATDGSDAAPVEDACAADNHTERWGLRIGAIFVILVSLGFSRIRVRCSKEVAGHTDGWH